MILFNFETSLEEFDSYLKGIGVISANENVIATEKPGEGNMNMVIRINTKTSSYILKQSRKFVQKYPEIPAPITRVQVEHSFYQNLNNTASTFFPRILHFDEDNFVLILEDLGNIKDMSYLYHEKHIEPEALKELVLAISEIHAIATDSKYPKNLELRKLNHQHIFELPFLMENGFNLDDVQPGLQAISKSIKNNDELKKSVAEIGQLYLSEGNTLLHGDYYPGSWIQGKNQIYVLDPEFSFRGFAEFDLGVMAAHLIMATGDAHLLDKIVESYNGTPDFQLTKKVTGIEIIRRLIGLAQLPIQRTLEEKNQLLLQAQHFVLS